MKFEEILAKDPSPGKKDRLRIEENLVIFPKWIIELDCRLKNYTYTTIDDDYIGYKKCSFGHITKVLKTNTQVLYDILKLGITSEEQRPKCPVCGKFLKFSNIVTGYWETCSTNCHLSYTKDIRITKESREKAAKTMIERKHTWAYRDFPEEAKKKISNTLSKKYKTGEIVTTEYKRNEARKRMLGNKLSVGRTSPRKGVKLSQEQIEKLRKSNIGRTLSKEHKDKISKRSSEYFVNHPDKLHEFILNGLKSKHGHVTINKSVNKDFYYMSSWEKRFVEYCDSSEEVIDIKEGKEFKILYTFKKSTHTYIPDVLLTLSNGAKVVIEIKPKSKLNTKKNKAKFKAAMIKCKSEGLIYLILTEEYIFKEDLSLLKILTERGLLN